jgi:hypothetical protein
MEHFNFNFNFNRSSDGFPSFSDRVVPSQFRGPSGYVASAWTGIDGDGADIRVFNNEIPNDDRTSGVRQTRDSNVDARAPSDRSVFSVHRKTRIKSLLWPVLVITIPMALLSAALLGLVFGYRVRSEPDLFASDAGSYQDVHRHSSYVLVNYPATRLVFAASFLSTLAPMLDSFIMSLWSLRIAQSMRTASSQLQYTRLPTPYQLSLVIGLTLASTERLRRYFGYLFSRSRPSIPPVVHHAAMILAASIVCAAAVFIADTALHYSTSTISFDVISSNIQPVYQYGRGLSQYCLDFDRIKNTGFPCSYNITVDDPNAAAEVNEIFYLQHNESRTSSMRRISNPELPHGDLALLMPQMQSVPATIDFRSSTIGVSTQCQPITSECDMRIANPGVGTHTGFNYSSGFFGVLGKSPNISEFITGFSPDPDLPPLGFKPAPNLQYGFFTDSNLSTPYNPEGYDLETDQPTLPPLPDTKLINPIYLGIAGRFSMSARSAGNSFSNDSGVFQTNETDFIDFALRCPIMAYDVNYTWANGGIQGLSFLPSPNGSMLEIYHGVQFYVTVSGGDYQLQDFLVQAAMQNTSDELAYEWASLYSTKVLSTIGGYTTSRVDLQEQQRTPILVAKVPKAALGALIACSLAYTFLGLGLGIAAYKASATDVRDLAAQLSLAGLTAAAFDDKHSFTLQRASTKNGVVFNEKLNRSETKRVLIDGNPERGYEFRVWV